MPYKTGKRERVSRKRRVNRKVRSKAIRRRTKKGGMGKVMKSVGSTLGKGVKTGATTVATKSFEVGKKGVNKAIKYSKEHDLAGKTKEGLKKVGNKSLEVGKRVAQGVGQGGVQLAKSSLDIAKNTGVQLADTAKKTGEATLQGIKQDPNKPAVEAPEEAPEAPEAPVAQTGASKRRRRGRRTNRKSKRGGNGCGKSKRGGYFQVGQDYMKVKRGGNHCMTHTKKR